MDLFDHLPHGPLTDRTVHLCVDMQRLFSDDTPWHTPWMPRVLPTVVRLAEARPAQTIFTRFVPPATAEAAPGAWRRYYTRWRDLTRDRIDPGLLELAPPLARLVPPARVLDKPAYSAFHASPLAGWLAARDIDSLVISGVETDVCVLATVLAAVDHGYRVVLADDALCGASDRTHDALMTLYHARFGQQVETAPAEVVLRCWL